MPSTKVLPQIQDTILTFPSDLGWMAAVFSGEAVKRLTFGHGSEAAARRAIGGADIPVCLGCGVVTGRQECLPHRGEKRSHTRTLRRLQAYAAGKPETLDDIPIDIGPLSDFQRRVHEQCRRIPYGQTMSYAELATKAGTAGAARAVGNCMAANRLPLLIPCHRVVCSDGRLGSYSAPGGIRMKRRLLALESES